MDRRTLGAWLGIPLLMAASVWIMVTTPVPDEGAPMDHPTSEAPDAICDAPLATSRTRNIGVLGLEVENTEVAEEHVAYNDRRMQWGYQAAHGDMHIALTWDAVSPAREVLELTVEDRYGQVIRVAGRSPIEVTMPVADIDPSLLWLVDLHVTPTTGTDIEVQTQGLRVEMTSSC